MKTPPVSRLGGGYFRFVSHSKEMCVKFSKENHHLIDQFGPEKFILEANKLPLKYRNLNVYPFGTVFQFVQYMCGYRAFLISMTNNNYTLTPFQKELQRLIRRIEAQITRLI